LSSFLSGSEVGTALREHSFETLAQVFALAEETQPGARHKAREALEFFNPLLIINRVGGNARLNQMKLRTLVGKYLGVNLPDLGEIPDDPTVSQALRSFLPVCEYAPDSPSAQAMTKIGIRLGKVVNLYEAKQRATAGSPAESD